MVKKGQNASSWGAKWIPRFLYLPLVSPRVRQRIEEGGRGPHNSVTSFSGIAQSSIEATESSGPRRSHPQTVACAGPLSHFSSTPVFVAVGSMTQVSSTEPWSRYGTALFSPQLTDGEQRGFLGVQGDPGLPGF